MNKQELWEDCFKNCMYAELSNASYLETSVEEINEWCKHSADVMVNTIIERRDRENNPKEKKP